MAQHDGAYPAPPPRGPDGAGAERPAARDPAHDPAHGHASGQAHGQGLGRDDAADIPAADPALIEAGFNLIQQALTIFDAQLRLVGWNARFTEMFDLPPELVRRGARFEDIIRFMAERGEYGPGPVDEIVRHRVERARAFEPHYFERDRPNGMTISIEGHPLAQGGWIAVYTDITHYRRQERLLRARSEDLSEQLLAHSANLARANRELAAANAALIETQRALMRSEARARLATETTPAHIAYVKRDYVYRYSNKRIEAVLGPGAAPAEIVGRPMPQVLGAEVFDKIRPALDRAFAGEQTRCAFQFRRADGEEAEVRCVFTPVREPDGAVRGVYILSLDVTEESRAAAALLQSKKMQAAAQLTRGLAHDFSNLLTVILGLQGRILDAGPLPDAVRDAAERTRAAARRGAQLIDRLSSIAAEREQRRARVDVADLLNGLVEIFAPSAPPGVSITRDVPAMLPPAWLDAGQLQDAVLNLLLNARDAVAARPEGPEGGEIMIAAAVADGQLSITVRDNGPGFDPEARERAFEPFFTTKGRNGSGLGLSMVYGFAQGAGGELTIRSAPGAGAAVTLTLPLGAPDEFERIAPGPALPAAIGGLALVADDDPELRRMVRETLQEAGWPVLEAADGEEALELARRVEEVGLVVSDIDMGPGMSGVELAERLTALRPGLGVILTTGLPPDAPERRRARGRFATLDKPFAAEQLRALLARSATEPA
ncbi:hybrid sensor histidine kinase/response regulator [Oceanicella actignis]|uniref:histidine kinase n=1 Tax=Oceanicella actignis TaxID=1189325 RepID=A0A1M7TKR3_9RHOB|nr:PAS-domain containing protein [Oceanicella actignis]SET68704.1 PAS domain S-box-containing protein [Oceanicella actignis]SHN71319.1 PAS domain S-box-containing protein [Oceanicella actignis]